MNYIIGLVLLTAIQASAQFGSASCGVKPFGSYGCRQVCVNGKWNEICDQKQQNSNQGKGSLAACGYKPLKNLGCDWSCVNGQWVEVCQ